MQTAQLTWLTNVTWGIPKVPVRDSLVRAKYRDVIPLMTAPQRPSTVFEDTEPAVHDMATVLDRTGVVEQEAVTRTTPDDVFGDRGDHAGVDS